MYHNNVLIVKICSVFMLLISANFSFLSAKSVIQDSLHIDGIHLVLNGTGYRSAIGMRMYTGGLYLEKKSNNADEIVNANASMAVCMEINSSLITGDRLEKSTREGFMNATHGDVLPIRSEIDSFLNLVKADLCKGDQYLFVYHPQNGTRIIKNTRIIGTIGGLQFKKALFGIWLCSKPPQQELKNGMLGL